MENKGADEKETSKLEESSTDKHQQEWQLEKLRREVETLKNKKKLITMSSIFGCVMLGVLLNANLWSECRNILEYLQAAGKSLFEGLSCAAIITMAGFIGSLPIVHWIGLKPERKVTYYMKYIVLYAVEIVAVGIILSVDWAIER